MLRFGADGKVYKTFGCQAGTSFKTKLKIVEHSTQAELEAISEKQVLPCIGRMMN